MKAFDWTNFVKYYTAQAQRSYVTDAVITLQNQFVICLEIGWYVSDAKAIIEMVV